MSISELERLKNLGPTSAAWLNDIGIHTRDDLERMGAVLAYKIVRHRRKRDANVLLLYALEGALRDIPWTDLSPADKARLKAEAAEPLDISFG